MFKFVRSFHQRLCKEEFTNEKTIRPSSQKMAESIVVNISQAMRIFYLFVYNLDSYMMRRSWIQYGFYLPYATLPDQE